MTLCACLLLFYGASFNTRSLGSVRSPIRLNICTKKVFMYIFHTFPCGLLWFHMFITRPGCRKGFPVEPVKWLGLNFPLPQGPYSFALPEKYTIHRQSYGPISLSLQIEIGCALNSIRNI